MGISLCIWIIELQKVGVHMLKCVFTINEIPVSNVDHIVVYCNIVI